MSDTQLAVAEVHASRLAQITGFSDQVIRLVQQTIAPNASRLELAAFLYNAKRLGLDPITGQIYFIKYAKDKPGEVVVGIDGYRARAEATGEYAGSDPAVFDYDECGQPQDKDGNLVGPEWPSKARVTVYRMVQGMRVPFSAEVRWVEFYPGPGPVGEQWRKRPHNQLAVRAESHALRKAFPRQTSDLQQHEAPPEWAAAAEVDEAARLDPELVKRNAAKYDEIFVDNYADDVADPKQPEASNGD